VLAPAEVALVMGLGVPTPFDHQSLWDEHFAGGYPANPLAARLSESVGVKTRHAVIDSRFDNRSSRPTI
jgi:hypothetical protein